MSRWSDEQDRLLRKLVRRNQINYQNLEPNYLFETTQAFFPDHVGEGPSARTTAIARLRKKFRQLAEEFELNGGRLPGACESTAIIVPSSNSLLIILPFQKILTKKKQELVNQKETEV